MTEAMPELPSNTPHVMRRIRACESEVPAQLVLEHYGASCYAAGVAAGMEKAAKICREKADGIRRMNTWRGKVNQPSGFAADMVDDAADQIGSAAIRMGEQ